MEEDLLTRLEISRRLTLGIWWIPENSFLRQKIIFGPNSKNLIFNKMETFIKPKRTSRPSLTPCCQRKGELRASWCLVPWECRINSPQWLNLTVVLVRGSNAGAERSEVARGINCLTNWTKRSRTLRRMLQLTKYSSMLMPSRQLSWGSGTGNRMSHKTLSKLSQGRREEQKRKKKLKSLPWFLEKRREHWS